ncbi:MAG TPA: DUF927 domain-containing protein [Nitrospiraceae bacterium]
MDVRDFLNAVVPWGEGYVTIHWHRSKTKGFFGRSCRTVDEALQVVRHIETTLTRMEIYFCLTSQRLANGERSRDNAIASRSLWTDSDVDPTGKDPKKYTTVNEAMVDLFRFCLLLEIPRPSIMVLSGKGLHSYWLSDRDLPIPEWQPYADALKVAAKNSSLRIDAGVTGDASRVLRVPGTINWKYEEPLPVSLIEGACSGRKFNFASTFAKILTLAPVRHAKPNGNLGEVPSGFAGLHVKSMGEGIGDGPPLPLGPIKAGCGWIREAHDTGGREFNNENWNLTTLCATWMENGHELAHHFGNQHPTYDYDKTEKEWDRKNRERRTKNIGWPQCRTIQNAGSRHCNSCPHRALDKSPLNLGFAAAPGAGNANGSGAHHEDGGHEEAEGLGGEAPKDFELPPGFYVNKDTGKICAVVPGKRLKNAGVAPPRLLQLCGNTIKNPTLHFQDGQFGISFTASTDKNNWHEVYLNSSNVFSPGLFTQLAAQGVIYTTGQEAKSFMEKLMSSWLQKLMNEYNALNESGTLGWRHEDGKRIGFVYGGVLHHVDGSEQPVVSTTDDAFKKWYMPVGRREPWLAAAKLLTDRKRPELDIIISVAFAAPLMGFAGNVYGCMVSIWGEPGTSKSTGQQVAAAVYGHPKQTRESLNSTAKSVQGRLGRTKNLPAWWDDIQDERHQEALFQTMFVATGGTEGGRLNPDASYKERKEWQTMMAICSNTSFVEFLVKKQKSTTAGMRRVFEFRYDRNPHEPGLIDEIDAHHIFAELEHNYGVIGREYIKLITTEHEKVSKLLNDVTRSFKESVNGTSDESFWWNTCGMLLTGAALANRLGAELDVKAMTQFLGKAYLKNRSVRSGEGTEGGSWTNTEQSLAAFLNYYTGAGHTICTDVTFVNRHQKIGILHYPIQGKPVYVHVIYNERKLLISKRMFREYLNDNEIQSRQVIEGLSKFFPTKEVRATLGAGTGLGTAQELCLEIEVPAGQLLLEEMFSAKGAPKS